MGIRFPLLALLILTAWPAPAQTPAQVEAEPLVKLRPGETIVDGQCLSQEQLDLIAGLNALRRPTVGVEGQGGGDDPAPFDPHYFVGAWEVDGVLPDSPLGESSEFYGTETVRHVGGCSYEGTIEAMTVDGAVRVEIRMLYDRRTDTLVRLEDDSRGFQLLKTGPVGGDPGGYFSHHWETALVIRGSEQVELSGRTFMLSPDATDVQMRISVDGGPRTNFGTLRYQRVIEEER